MFIHVYHVANIFQRWIEKCLGESDKNHALHSFFYKQQATPSWDFACGPIIKLLQLKNQLYRITGLTSLKMIYKRCNYLKKVVIYCYSNESWKIFSPSKSLQHPPLILSEDGQDPDLLQTFWGRATESIAIQEKLFNLSHKWESSILIFQNVCCISGSTSEDFARCLRKYYVTINLYKATVTTLNVSLSIGWPSKTLNSSVFTVYSF